ncbi:MAG TPA: SpoIIE family protein phosphatase [Pyrinomonadaceae bacterium]
MKRFDGATAKTLEFAARVRAALRRTMPRVALVAAGLLVLWVILGNTSISETRVDNFFDRLTFLAVASVALYYCVLALHWTKRKLLWRVRRRLLITYLFVGLTPLVLLGVLGILAWLVLSGQAMSRIVNVQINATEQVAQANADALAAEFLRRPIGASASENQRWLDERMAVLQAGLPGARAAVWRGGAGQRANTEGEELGVVGEGRAADFMSAAHGGEEARGIGVERVSLDAPLPAWLRGQERWSGFAFVPPPDESADPFGTPSVRALVRRGEGERGVAVLLVVPVSRALVRQFRESTGIALRPYFLGARKLDVNVATKSDGISINSRREPDGERQKGLELNPDAQLAAIDNAPGDRDQFGDQLPNGPPYIVALPATDWLNGEVDTHLSFLFEYSLAEARRQLLDSSAVGEVIQKALVALAIVFLALELVALLAAAWMTRAVTGTVHKLHLATQFIKRGDFSHRIRTRSHDQLGELAAAFNDMSANIEVLLEERVERERLEREVEIAAEVQAQLFPRSLPALTTAEVTGECRAARGVAGDYYDYVEVEPGLVAFVLGDVSGKGISAALVMSNLQASLRAQVTIISERRRLVGLAAATTTAASAAAASDGGEGLGACGVTGADSACAVENMVSSINQQLCRSTDSNRFATLFLALYDDRARTLRYTNAGHNTPILVRANGRVERLDVGGTIVGVFDFVTYEEAQARLDLDDLLVVFSDGISEAQNAAGEEYGEERIVQLAAANRHLAADDLRHKIFDEVDKWSGDEERGDDQTLVILKAVISDE